MANYFSLAFVFILLCSHSLPQNIYVTMNKNVQTLFATFKQCHIKFMVVKGSQDFTHLLSSLHQKSLSAISIESALYASSYHKSTKFTNCFCHFYLLGTVYDTEEFLARMHHADQINERPSYFIFFEMFDANLLSLNETNTRLHFYSNKLISTFVNGIVLGIGNFEKPFLVCITCPHHAIIQYTTFTTTLKDLSLAWKQLYSNLHGTYISTGQGRWEESLIGLRACTGFVGKLTNPWETVLTPGMEFCLHFAFGQKLNYTITSNNRLHLTQSNNVEHATVSYSKSMVTESILERKLRQPTCEWLSYDTNFESFYFVVALKKPMYNLKALYKPFDLSTRIFLSFSVFGLYIMLRLKSRLYTTPVFLKVFATFLDQPVSFRYLRRISLSLVSWAMWNIPLLILMNAYKGKIFSRLTNSIELNWPENLGDLVKSPYLLETFSYTVKLEGGGFKAESIFRDHWLKTMMAQNVGMEYGRVYKRLKIRMRGSYDFSRDIIKKYMKLKETILYPSVKPVPTHNFAIIDDLRQSQFISFALTAFVPNLVLSKPVYVPRFLTVSSWTVSNNYFRPIFNRILARFYESGISEKLKQHIVSCSYISFLQLMEITGTQTGQEEFIQSGIRKAKAMIHYGDSWKEALKVPQITLGMLGSVFFVWICFIVLSVIVLIIEVMVRFCNVISFNYVLKGFFK